MLIVVSKMAMTIKHVTYCAALIHSIFSNDTFSKYWKFLILFPGWDWQDPPSAKIERGALQGWKKCCCDSINRYDK